MGVAMTEEPRACPGITPLVWLHVVVAGLVLWGLIGFALRHWGILP